MKNILALLLIGFQGLKINAQVVEPSPYMIIKCNKSVVTDIDISPKGDILAVALGEYAELWDIEKQKKIATLKHEVRDGSKMVYYIAFSPKGEYVVTIDYKGDRKVWNVKNGKEIKSIRNYTKWIPTPRTVKDELGLKLNNSDFYKYYTQKEAKHPKDKDIIAYSTENSSVEFHNLVDGAIEQELVFPDTKDKEHLYPVYFSPNGDIFITGNDRGEVFFYKLVAKSKF